MERRGSGIGRILSGYTEFDRQPEFFSDPDFFIVTLPNKGFDPKSKGLSGKSKGLSESSKGLVDASKGLSEVSKGFSGESQPDSSMELEQFGERVYMAFPMAKRKTVERISELFRRYRYEYTFNRNNVAGAFEITVVSASGMIRQMVQQGLAEKVGTSEYRFVRQ